MKYTRTETTTITRTEEMQADFNQGTELRWHILLLKKIYKAWWKILNVVFLFNSGFYRGDKDD